MTSFRKFALMASVASVAMLSVGSVSAQEITGSIRGGVTDESGASLAGATIVVIDNQTGYRRTVTTGPSGDFSIRNLSVGGNYSVSVTRSGYQGEQIDNLTVNLGESTSLNFDLDVIGEGAVDNIVVVGTQTVASDVAVGPNAVFDLATLKTAPAINRNLTDVIRIDARFYVDESRGDINAIQCGGKNSRFNSLTVDGVRQNDNFGLNSNGYPTERIPFSFDAIQQVAVELAPYDVQYGGFSACNINAVTKSGSNEFHGSFFYDFTSDDFRADSLEGDDLSLAAEEETRWGFTVGGPIIQDRLFFFAAYETLDGVNTFDRGPIGSGAVNEVLVTQAELDEIADIALAEYGYDVGETPQSAGNEDEKILLKLDWHVSEMHRASFTYQYNDGFNISQSDGDSDEFEFSNHLYERGAELTSYVGSLFSDWTDNFSTEIRIGKSTLDNRQISVGGTDFGEIRVELDDVDVYLGGDDSRQSNKLYYETLNYVLRAYYSVNDHQLTFGFEREDLDVFNLFVQHTETEIRFDGMANFEAGLADAVYYNNAPSQDPNDAAAVWGYSANTFYLQDEVDFGRGVVLTAGVRYDWYETGDSPEVNADFLADYGFGNDANLDGVDLLQPRVGLSWDVNESLELRSGFGLYSGGNPNVWYSNNFSANNVNQFGVRGRDMVPDLTDGGTSLFDIDYVLCEDGVPTGPGYCIPEDMADAVALGDGANFEINYLDPEFEMPKEWKMSLGGTYYMQTEGFGEFTLNADILYSVAQDSAIWLRGDLEQDGTVDYDGRTYPTYDSVREAAFVLTNSETDAKSWLYSVSIAKEHDFGLNWGLGYAYSDAEDINPMTSSVAFSNYVNRAFADPQEEIASTSDYNIKHRFTAIATYEKAYWGDNMTRISAFGTLRSGRPYSIVHPGYISTGCDIYCFTPYLDYADIVLTAGEERNAHEGSWFGKIDLKFEQEFAGFGDHKASAYIVIDNFTNLLSDEWGIMRDTNFPSTSQDHSSAESRVGDASRYEIRFGVRYEF